ncbi:MAG: flagellar hook-associated protein FlgL [Verrucomicrobia bacterium]|nr:flagellar hook-associated protein FlgL [Verrucomicrobiota bacterium]
MRVTASSFPNVIRSQLERLSTQQARLQTQAATGQRFHLASDDPRAMRKVLDLQTDIKLLTQYEKNIGTLKDTQTATFAAINDLKKVSDRAGEIAVRGDNLRTPQELEALATEVDQLIERAVQLSNTRHQGNYIFGGTKNTSPPFDVTRNAQSQITSVAYNGSGTVTASEIGENINISVSVPGVNTTGSGTRGLLQDTSAGADLLAHLISLRDNLLSNNSAAIRTTDLPNLLKDEENILYHFGSVGAEQTRLDTAASIINARKTSLDGLVSQESDADLARTLVVLGEIENAYVAALKTAGTILNQSLLDFIR